MDITHYATFGRIGPVGASPKIGENIILLWLFCYPVFFLAHIPRSGRLNRSLQKGKVKPYKTSYKTAKIFSSPQGPWIQGLYIIFTAFELMKISLLFYMCHFATGLTCCYKTDVFFTFINVYTLSLYGQFLKAAVWPVNAVAEADHRVLCMECATGPD